MPALVDREATTLTKGTNTRKSWLTLRVLRVFVSVDQRIRASLRLAVLNTASIIDGVRRPVLVFCRLG